MINNLAHLYLIFTSCEIDFASVKSIVINFLLASATAFCTASATSIDLPVQIATLPFLLPMATVALNRNLLQPLTTRVTLARSNNSSENSFFSFLGRLPRLFRFLLSFGLAIVIINLLKFYTSYFWWRLISEFCRF